MNNRWFDVYVALGYSMEAANHSTKSIKIDILFFGQISETIGQRRIEVILKEGTNLEQLIKRFQLMEFINSGVKISIDDLFCDDFNTVLQDSSVVALLPPFSGG